MSQLFNKVAIVLGAAGKDNMGQVIARRLHAEGAKAVVAGRNLEELDCLAAELNGLAVCCDITSKADIENLFCAAITRYGHVDIVVNATGWGLLKSFEETTEADLRKMSDLQYIGPYMLFQEAVKRVTAPASLIQISSATAKIMFEDHSAYMGTKAGIDHVVRCIANEYGNKGIRANSVSPGLTETPMTAEAKQTPGLFDAFVAGYPLGRIGTSEDIASAIVWLAGDECFMTGENLQVNGGLTLRRNPMKSEIEAAVVAAAQ
ncbi:SDR family oxidoreductase [Halopseudomonas sp. SMJS2]|uniref:SDR family NAD(P)-dependent oxidoreductase n=1 Tax=Halopseudomonas sp. SMJS2 TaxID=3041098 RepID=UPI002452FF50|nr:SDR family oxidoreductase [Halopseudomonas sp. SMJS2]WGK62447.1 SDR family oxidoreductase [Halopseudomonas sp. SMJS2]